MPTQLLEWASAADHCQLPTLHLQCLSEVASRLVGGHGSISLASAFADAAMVAERCDKSMLAQLLGLVVAGTTPGCVPTPEDAAAALQEAANARSFEWEMACDLDAPPSYGLAVCSPWFASGGRQWGFEVMVNDGDDDYELVAGKLTGACLVPLKTWCRHAPCASTRASAAAPASASQLHHPTPPHCSDAGLQAGRHVGQVEHRDRRPGGGGPRGHHLEL